jgi:hypothetical protein
LLKDDENVEDVIGKIKPFPKMFIRQAAGDIAESPEAEVWIVADNTVMIKFEGSILEGCFALLSTYYVFMFMFPNSLTNFYTYLHKCILGIPDRKKMPAAVKVCQ